MDEKKEPFLEHTDNIIFCWLELVSEQLYCVLTILPLFCETFSAILQILHTTKQTNFKKKNDTHNLRDQNRL